MLFKDRRAAGRALAGNLASYAGLDDVLVLALPRGGVPVGYEVARALDIPLDVFVVRKLGVPGQPELAMGAIASGGVRVLNEEVLRIVQVPPALIDQIEEREREELRRRELAYREGRPALDVTGKSVILVDDGLATGSTMRAAVRALKHQHAARVIVAVPVGASESCLALEKEADQVICLEQPEDFRAVGLWYDDFTQTTDAEVRELLEKASSNTPVQAK
jgi:predicted phosphoribosyltransferase